MRAAACFFLLFLCFAHPPLAGADKSCADLKAGIQTGFQAVKDATLNPILDDKTIPSDRQVVAPSASSSGTTLVDHASFPTLLGAALDQGLITSGDHMATLSLNLFAFESLYDSTYLTSQTKYEMHETARKFGGALTLGGKGEGFDGKGNKLDQPAQASELGDIVDLELRYRFWGSTDRRDPKNYNEIFDAVGPAFRDVAGLSAAFFNKNAKEISAVSKLNGGCPSPADVKAFLSAHADEISKVGAAMGDTKEALDEAGARIDKHWVWSFVVGGTERKQPFGTNSYRAGLHVDLGKTAGHQNTLNLDYSRHQAFPNGQRPTVAKLAFEHSYLWKKGSRFAPDGIDISSSFSAENDRDVADAKHPSNVKANVKLEYPISKTAKIPISISWANHRDLLTGEKSIRGHIGFTFDFSKLTTPVNDTK